MKLIRLLYNPFGIMIIVISVGVLLILFSEGSARIGEYISLGDRFPDIIRWYPTNWSQVISDTMWLIIFSVGMIGFVISILDFIRYLLPSRVVSKDINANEYRILGEWNNTDRSLRDITSIWGEKS